MLTSKRIKIIIPAVIVVIIASYVVGYVIALKSDAFATLTTFLKSNETVQNQLGTISSIDLGLFSYSIRRSGPSGNAKFETNVVGAIAVGKVYAELYYAGEWSILTASLILNDGTKIKLHSTAQ